MIAIQGLWLPDIRRPDSKGKIAEQGKEGYLED
jgi:hypothetical protein